MNRKKTLIVALVFSVAALATAGSYVRRARGAAQARANVDHTRKIKGVLPPVRSTVAGVTLTATLEQAGDNEFANVTIENNTDQGIDAYEIAAPPRRTPGGTTETQFFMRLDARRAQKSGDIFKLDPDEPLIPPHDKTSNTIGLLSVPDGGDLTLTAVAFHHGALVGSRAKQFERDRALEADEHGFHNDLRALNAKLASGQAKQ
jgi:hypothetical protein